MRQSTIAFRNNSLEYSLPENETPLPQTQTESTETSRLRVRVFQLESEVAALKVRVRELERKLTETVDLTQDTSFSTTISVHSSDQSTDLNLPNGV